MEKKNENKYFEAELVFDTNISDELKEEIISVLSTTRFNKLSYPIYTYSHLIFDKVEVNESKVSIVGYIKKFIKDDNKFVIALYNKNKEVIEKFSNAKIKVVFNEYNNKLGVITKIIIFDDKNS